jgi:hypothetical protein
MNSIRSSGALRRLSLVFRTDQAAAVKQVYVVAYRNELIASGLKPKNGDEENFNDKDPFYFRN